MKRLLDLAEAQDLSVGDFYDLREQSRSASPHIKFLIVRGNEYFACVFEVEGRLRTLWVCRHDDGTGLVCDASTYPAGLDVDTAILYLVGLVKDNIEEREAIAK